MPSYLEKVEPILLPVIALRNTVPFPGIPLNFEVNTEEAIAAAKAASAFLFLTTYRPDGKAEDGFPFCRIGCVVRVKQMIRTPEGPSRIIAEGVVRATVTSYRQAGNYVEADLLCKSITLPDRGGIKGEALVHEMLASLEENAKFLPADAEDLLSTAKLYANPGDLADFIAANLIVRTEDKLEILECFDPLARAERLLEILASEADILEEESIIRQKVNERMNRNQREYYLREQIKVIEEELGEGSDIEEYAKKIEEANLPKEVKEKFNKEKDRLAKTPYGSAEATVIAGYLDTCLEIPWSKSTESVVRFEKVQKILDEDHYGLEKVKERIVEFMAAKEWNPALKNQILCLVGPPGVGKTSIASSIARATNRKYARISLGGVRDEADIRGHRKTYIGAMPGRIIAALTQAGVNNPLLLLDEIDKLTKDAHGDPTSALLEVLDGEQNKTFRDHFVELPFDLSDCFFIATANSLENIPKPLIDRMEIIELGIYTKREKLAIAKEHLIKKQMKRHALSGRQFKLSDDAILELIDYYTHEAGVRNLERAIASLCRKASKQLLAGNKKSVRITEKDISSYLGARKRLPETIDENDEVGVVNGLAYTELGGSLLQVEVAVLEGTGKIETTGSLGDVMKESAKIAVSFVRSIAEEYEIPTDFYRTKDLHIHFPEGAVPKDGPSAGVAMTVALVSALTGRKVRHDIAMTGEVSLRGKVLPIGGLKEKTMAAYNAGVKIVLLPKENLRDLEEIDSLARENLKFVPLTEAKEALSAALLPAPVQKEKARPAEKESSPLHIPAKPNQPAAHCSESRN
ncbi:MAG: endopeptidase La [Clostridia bacterium]|nr:endopeptidase La [Clostridia bacterium]